MKRWYIFKDGQQIAATAEYTQALEMIRQYQAQETHYLLRANFSLIHGEEIHISYKGAEIHSGYKKKGDKHEQL